MITRLDHANLRTAQLDVLVEWYERVLGFRTGWRPDFPFPGAWLYVEDQPLIHLVGVEGPVSAGSNLSLEHVAFSAHGLDEFRNRLNANKVLYDEVVVPGAGILQVNVWDPDGNHLHIDFDQSEDG